MMEPTARRTDPETSHQAAAIASLKAGTNREIAYRVLSRYDGLTDFELASFTGIAQTSIGVRRGELVKLGLVEDSGERRKSPSGASAIVWRVSATL